MKQLLRVALVAGLVCLAAVAGATPRIEISFEADTSADQKLVHARAEFSADASVTRAIFSAISAYPQLHHWIRESNLVGHRGEFKVYVVRFRFPWPVGEQWSRLEVLERDNSISWRQIEGTLKANHGRISFHKVRNRVRIDYSAAIDVGLPELWTRAYKKQFIRDFMTAASELAESGNSQASIATPLPAAP
jgi:uncharacterized membrane protein